MSKVHRVRLEPPAPVSFTEHISAFTAAVDFSEPAILLLFASHLILLLVALRVREGGLSQILLFAYLIAACFALGRVNEWLRGNWQWVVGQNYFDESGLFLSVLIGLPYLSICFLLVVLCKQIFSLKRNFTEIVALAKRKEKHD